MPLLFHKDRRCPVDHDLRDLRILHQFRQDIQSPDAVKQFLSEPQLFPHRDKLLPGRVKDHPVDHLKGGSALISGPSGERTVRSPSGKYDSKKKELTLEDAKGYWKRPQYPLTYETPLAHWTQNGDHWDFPHGVTVSGDVYSLECESAEMSGQRNIRVKNGCLVWWSQ